MVRITRLHIIMIAVITVIFTVFIIQIFMKARSRQHADWPAHAQAPSPVRVIQKKEVDYQKVRDQQIKPRMKTQREKHVSNETETEKKELLAKQAIAVAGEYWIIARKQGLDYTVGQATLRKAKKAFKDANYDIAWDLARKSIKELKTAPSGDKYYRVRGGDSLWEIAKMPCHYGRGAMWVKIWRANEKKDPGF